VIKNIIAIYPGRFQPFSRHHADAFKWLESKFGNKDTYIATTDKVDLPKSPLNFKDKKSIIDKFGYGANLVQVVNPYKSEEITKKYNPKDTAIVFMVGEKDMKDDPRFSMAPKKDGSPGYFKPYKGNENKLEGFDRHGYLIVSPHDPKEGETYEIPGFGRLNGTNVRAALSTTEDPAIRKKLFTSVFGWYDPKIDAMLKQKFNAKALKEAQNFINRLILEQAIKHLISEGGAAGHMAHPFDLPQVKTGKDLLNVFDQTVDYLKKDTVNIKIDGVNASIRLADIDGKKQFVMDRGSNKPLDVKGITKADLTDRFGEGHGMIKVGGVVLDIFNEGISKIKPQLEKLGMWKDPNIMLNIEYVEGGGSKTNVQQYEKNFIAIHGLLKIEQVSPTKRSTSEIPYDKTALSDMMKNLSPIAHKKGFSFMFNEDRQAKLIKTPNFSSALSQKYTINYDGKKKETKSLDQLLNDAKNTKGEKLKLKDGKTIDALSKQVFLWVKEGKPLSELVKDPADYKTAIDSFAIYMATMEMGDILLKSMDSKIGSPDQQEGIVIDNPKIYKGLYKITGSFIVRGMASAFQK
jgi:hypothetical protein